MIQIMMVSWTVKKSMQALIPWIGVVRARNPEYANVRVKNITKKGIYL